MPPTTVPLTTADTVAQIHARFRAFERDPHAQPVPGYIDALLFATGMDGPVPVKVPMILPDTPNEWSNVLYMPWLAPDSAHPMTNLSYIDMDVSDSALGEVAYTVFAPDQDGPMGRVDLLHPVNKIFAAAHLPGVPAWRGNILVMRRSSGTSILVDMRESDRQHAVQCAVGVATSHGAGGSPMPFAMAEDLRTHLLRAHLAYYHGRKHTLAFYNDWRWVQRGAGLNAQTPPSGRITTGFSCSSPVRFTVFGMVRQTDRQGVIVLERPHWTTPTLVGRDLTLQYDMQLLTLARVLDQHGWEPEIPRDEIVLTVEGDGNQIESGSLFFATVLLTIKTDVDDGALEAYLMDVVQYNGRYLDKF
ncbi:hypothetical protein C8R47DRAFT_1075532 [Mycena vitilis]|nr:hypothetical protein C8R47DRAFT_1075532 [Mycena vitilis]